MPVLARFPLRLLLATFALGLSQAVVAVDLEKGKEINGTCAACHGEFGQGGKKGEYPRLAGQRVRYLETQLRAFRTRSRVNIPMFPYTQERELSDDDIRDVAAYLAGVELPTQMPTFTGREDALTRLQMVDKVMIVPRAEGDPEAGEVLYRKQCAACHGTSGRGKGMFPMLTGQYTNYLRRQIDLYVKGDRAHDEETSGGRLNALSDAEIRNILAFLTTQQGPRE